MRLEAPFAVWIVLALWSRTASAGFLRKDKDDNKNKNKESRQLYYSTSDVRAPFNEICTALVGVQVDPADPSGEESAFLACMTPSGMIHKYHGMCKDWIHSYIDKSKLISNQTQIDTEGTVLDGPTDELVSPQFPPKFSVPGELVPIPTTGNRTIVGIRVVTNDAEPTVTEPVLRDSLFGTGGNPVNLADQIKLCSANKLNLQPADGFSALLAELRRQLEEEGYDNSDFEDGGDGHGYGDDDGDGDDEDSSDEDYDSDEEGDDGNSVLYLPIHYSDSWSEDYDVDFTSDRFDDSHQTDGTGRSRRRKLWGSDPLNPPKPKYLSKYLMVGTGSQSNVKDSVLTSGADLGANIILLSMDNKDENLNLDLSAVFFDSVGQMWVNGDDKVRKRHDYLPGAARMFESVTWTGDFVLTAPDSKFTTQNTELYGHYGIYTDDKTPQVSHTSSRFYPFGVGDGVDHDKKGSRDLYRALKKNQKKIMGKFRQELRDVEAWLADLAPEHTVRPGTDGLTGNGFSNLDVVEWQIDTFDVNEDGIAVIDIDMEGADFVLSNTNWIIETENKTFAIFRLIGDTNLVATRSTIMSGDQIVGNADPNDPSGLYDATLKPSMNQAKIRSMFVKTQSYRITTTNNNTKPGAAASSTSTVFDLTDVVLNGIGFYDLVSFKGDAASEPNDGGKTSLSLTRAQGCAQFVSPKITMTDVRLNLCYLASNGIGKKAFAGNGCKAKGVGTSKASQQDGTTFSECPEESYRCSRAAATDEELALIGDLGPNNQTEVILECEVQVRVDDDYRRHLPQVEPEEVIHQSRGLAELPDLPDNCAPASRDICIAFDLSGSICSPPSKIQLCTGCASACHKSSYGLEECCPNYRGQRSFISDVISVAGEFTGTQRFSVVSFSTESYTKTGLTTAINAAETVGSIAYTGGWTNTGDAIQDCLNTFTNPNSERVIVLMTDGTPTRGGGGSNGGGVQHRNHATTHANAAKAAGVTILPVVVNTGSTDVGFLRSLGSYDNALIEVNDFTNLEKTMNKVLTLIGCGSTQVTTFPPTRAPITTPPPTERPTGRPSVEPTDSPTPLGATITKTVRIRAITQYADHWYQFESLTNDFFISKVGLGYNQGANHVDVFWENNGKYVINYGGVVKTGVFFLPKLNRRNFHDLERVDMCVVKRSKACEKPFVPKVSEAVEPKNEAAVPNVIEEGSYTMTIPNNCSDGHSAIVNQAIQQLVDKFDVKSPSELADHILLCLPDCALNQTTYAYSHSWLSVYNDAACLSLNSQMKNIGTNLGLGPSHEWPEEDGTKTWDDSGPMGNDTPNDPQKCYNAAKSYQLKWFEPREAFFDGIADDPVSLTLTGPTKPDAPAQTKIVQLKRTNPTRLYVMCNWANGANADAANANKVTLVQAGRFGGHFTESLLQVALGPGETFTRPNYFDGICNLTVSVGAVDTTAGTCQIDLEGCPVDMPTAAPTVTPTDPTSAPTPLPSYGPTTQCRALDEICLSEDECCDGGTGACIWEDDHNGMNVKIVCKFDPSAFIDPLSYPGVCTPNGICEWGENCYSCSEDCNGLLTGPREERYCCDGALGKKPPGAAPIRSFAPTPAPTAGCRVVNMDFAGLERGAWVGSQLVESNGIRFSAMGKANSYCWTPDENGNRVDYGNVRVFDTWIPTGGSLCNPSEGDPDLGSPNQYCKDEDIPGSDPRGYPNWRKPGYGIGGAPRLDATGQPSDTGEENQYANCVPQGKALVIQGANKTCPDECEYGGLFLIQFPFTNGANVHSITLLNLNRAPRMQIWTEHGGRVSDDILPLTGRNSVLEVKVDVEEVRAIRFSFYGTAAISKIEYTWCQSYAESGTTAIKTIDKASHHKQPVSLRSGSTKSKSEAKKERDLRDFERKMKASPYSIRPDDPKCKC